MANLLDEIAARLIQQSVGVQGSTADWCVHKGHEPEAPDAVFTLFETGGLPNQPHDGNLLDLPTFQVRVRGGQTSTGYPAARAKIAAARTALEGMSASTYGVSHRYYCQVTANSEPISLGHDESHRPRLVMNFTALRSRN
jgi:hypothetical protein